MDSIEEQIEIAVASACSESAKSASSPKTRNKKSATNVDVGDIITKVMVAIQPMMVAMVTAAVKASNEGMMAELKKISCPASTASTVQTNKFEIDRLEQYSRKDNVKVVGIPETEGENCVEKVKELGRSIGVDLQDNDISVAHRVKSRGKRGNPMIVRFVRRESKVQMMMNKRKLKEQKKDIYIQEDLTQLRGKMLWMVKQDEGTEAAWARDGKVHCLLKEPCRHLDGTTSKKVILDSPEDLFAIGWDEEKVKGLYVGSV